MGVLTATIDLLPAEARRRVIVKLHKQLTKRTIAEVTAVVAEVTGGIVHSGPFKGMAIPKTIGWPRYHIAPKLLGTYEGQLAASIAELCRRRPAAVVNVGGAEGYYAVGLARLLPKVPIVAFDLMEHCRQDISTLANANGVSVSVQGGCTVETLNAALRPDAAVVMDCEGVELELLDPAQSPDLKTADIIVESHSRKHITPVLIDRFHRTHTITIIEEGNRPIVPHPGIAHLSAFKRMMAVLEERGPAMHWLFLRARARSTNGDASTA